MADRNKILLHPLIEIKLCISLNCIELRKFLKYVYESYNMFTMIIISCKCIPVIKVIINFI